MAVTNKEILQRANEAISKGDVEGFLIHCTEDTVWNFLGDKSLQGKAAVRQWMKETYKVPPKFNVRQLIAEGELVAAMGEITLANSSGREATYSYCDVWRFDNGLLAELNAYVVEKAQS